MARRQNNQENKDETIKQTKTPTNSRQSSGGDGNRAKNGLAKAGEKGKKGMAPESKSPAKGINRLPRWLHEEKRLSDTMAGSLVVLLSGGLIMLLVFVLTKVWPATS